MTALWQQCMNDLSSRLDMPNLRIWISPLQPVLNGDTLTLFAPNQLIVERVREEFLPAIQDSLQRLAPRHLAVKLSVGSGAESTRQTPPARPQTPLPQRLADCRLNPSQSLEAFITGPSNQLAYDAVCNLIGQQAGGTLFVCGDVSVGKTHLLNAAGIAFLKRHPDRRLLFLPAQQLAYELIKACSTKSLETLKQKLHAADLLLIDDLKLLAKKPWVQEELLQLHDAQAKRGGRIIVADEHSPGRLPLENRRLTERLSAMLTCRIETPSASIITSFIQQTSRAQGLALDARCAMTIASRIEPSPRIAEGAVRNILAELQQQPGHPLSPARIEEILNRLCRTAPPATTPARILLAATDRFGTDAETLLSNSKRKTHVQARHFAMSLMRDATELSLPDIARIFKRNHTTVINAIRQTHKRRKSDPRFNQTYLDDLSALKDKAPP